MTQLDFPLLSLLLVLPLVGAIAVAFMPQDGKNDETEVKLIALITTIAVFLLSLILYFSFESDYAGFQFVEDRAWIPGLNIRYHLGVDGISLFIVLLTTLLSVLAVSSSWTAITEHLKAYLILLLVMETAMLGVFMAIDMFLFYVFWEFSLIPMALLIGIWGGNKKIYASVKFVIYTFVASTLMLVGILAVYFQAGGTADLSEILAMDLALSRNWQIGLFFAFGLAFAVKVPLFPFHTWLPSAHVQAPTAGSIILAGVLLKMGTYGYLRFTNPMFPLGVEYWAPLLSILAIIGILYGALVGLGSNRCEKLDCLFLCGAHGLYCFGYF